MTIDQHTKTALAYTVYTLGDDGDCQAWVACIGHRVNDSPEVIEARWNELAKDMWRRGIEPVQDEPFFTHEEDGVVCDHYICVETINEAADELPLGRDEYDKLV